SAGAAAAVCFAPGTDELDALRRLESLVDKSPLPLRPGATEHSQPRFAMLESIRDYARARQEGDEREELQRRHAAYFLDLTERGIPEVSPATRDVPLAALAAAEEEPREERAWAFEQDAPEPALRLTGSLWWYWYMRGQYREGRHWVDRAVARSASVRSPARARTLLGAGRLAYLQCDYPVGEAMLEASGELSRALGERRVLAAPLHFSASIARERGDYARARALHDESFALWRELGDEHGVARSSNYVAFLRWLEADLDAAEAPAEDAYARFTALDDREGLAWALLNGAAIAYYRRQLAVARQEAREALALASEAGYQEGIAWALNLLGNVALREHRAEQARALLRRSLELHRDLGDRWRMCSVLASLAARLRGGRR